MNHLRIISRVKFKIKQLFLAKRLVQKNFKGLHHVANVLDINLENQYMDWLGCLVHWFKPRIGVVKLNTDGSVTNNKWDVGA